MRSPIAASYFETLNVEPGSRWAKTITLGFGRDDPLSFTAKVLDFWKVNDPDAPTRVRVCNVPNGPFEGTSDDLRSFHYLGLDRP